MACIRKRVITGIVLATSLVFFVQAASSQETVLGNGVPLTTFLPGLTYANAYIEVPPNATVLTVTLSQGSGDLDLYVKHGTPVTGSSIGELSSNADFRSEGLTADEHVTVTPSSSPPLRAGKWYAATLNLNNTTTHFTLTATYSVPASVPNIATDVTSLDFGSIAVGNSSQKAVTVSNTGTATLSISSLTLTGSNAGEFSTSGDCSSLAAGSTCAMTVTFRPGAAGTRAAVLNIASNDPDTPTVGVPLSGTGTEAGGGAGGLSGSGAARLSFLINDPFLVPWGHVRISYQIKSFKTGTMADLYLVLAFQDGTLLILGATPTNPIAPFVSGFPLADADILILDGALSEHVFPSSFVLYGVLVRAGETPFNIENWLSGPASISFSTGSISGEQWEVLAKEGNPQSARVEFHRDRSLRIESWIYPGFQTYKFYNGSLQRSPDGTVAASAPGTLEPPIHFSPDLFHPTTTAEDIRKKLGDPDHVFSGATPDTKIWVFDRSGVSLTIKDKVIRMIEVY